MSFPKLTLVIKQPNDPRAQQLLYEQVTHVVRLYGGSVIARVYEDEVTLHQRVTERLPPDEVDLVGQALAIQSNRK
ncbi:hypothetical protein ACIPI6_24125 [Pseudomonas protegens]|uniref:hypothetical protein n=1 Tax=Pseudomonas protegens TaxID=380021 RepID=UPI0038249FB7